MSDDDDTYYSDDEQEFVEAENERKEVEDAEEEESESEWDDDEEEESDQVGFPEVKPPIYTPNTDYNDDQSMATADDKSRVTSGCSEAMELLRTATLLDISKNAARKALELVYELCRTRFNAKTRLGESGAAEYLVFLYQRWMEDPLFLIYTSKILSEFMITETENKILLGIQGLDLEIVRALKYHRDSQWTVVQVSCQLLIDLCNNIMHGVLETHLKPNPKLAKITAYQEAKEQMAKNKAANAQQSQASSTGLHATTTTIHTNNNNNNNNLLNSSQKLSPTAQTNITKTPSNKSSQYINQTLTMSDWLVDNRRKLGKAGICRLLVHYLATIANNLSGSGGGSSGIEPSVIVKRLSLNTAHHPPADTTTAAHHGHGHHHAAPHHPPHHNGSQDHHQDHSDHGPSHSHTSQDDHDHVHAAHHRNHSHAGTSATAAAVAADESNTSSNSSNKEKLTLPPIHPSTASSRPSSATGTAAGGQHLRKPRPSSATNHSSSRSASHSRPSSGRKVADTAAASLTTVTASSTAAVADHHHPDHHSAAAAAADHHKDHHHKDHPDHHLEHTKPPLPAPMMRHGSTVNSHSSASPSSSTAADNIIASSLGNSSTAAIAAAGGGIGGSSSHRHTSQHLGLVDTKLDPILLALGHAIACLAESDQNAHAFAQEHVNDALYHILVVCKSNPARLTPILWCIIVLCSDKASGNKEMIGELGGIQVLVDLLHEVMRHPVDYTKGKELLKYVDYLTWALLNMILACPRNQERVRHIPYAEVVIDNVMHDAVHVVKGIRQKLYRLKVEVWGILMMSP